MTESKHHQGDLRQIKPSFAVGSTLSSLTTLLRKEVRDFRCASTLSLSLSLSLSLGAPPLPSLARGGEGYLS
ncbi:MAG: hypothetical protein LBQ02_00875 [Candidatus Nomurabacteria bacterium]|nr:hypothetical protein [Candidatus Nomurabacteria bacterium]